MQNLTLTFLFPANRRTGRLPLAFLHRTIRQSQRQLVIR
jgi:hypothetical protein